MPKLALDKVNTRLDRSLEKEDHSKKSNFFNETRRYQPLHTAREPATTASARGQDVPSLASSRRILNHKLMAETLKASVSPRPHFLEPPTHPATSRPPFIKKTGQLDSPASKTNALCDGKRRGVVSMGGGRDREAEHGREAEH